MKRRILELICIFSVCFMMCGCFRSYWSTPVISGGVVNIYPKDTQMFIDDSLKLVVKNLTKEAIEINTPRVYSNTHIRLIDRNKKEPVQLLLINPSKYSVNELISIGGYDSVSVTYARKLNQLYRLEAGNYQVQMHYDGYFIKQGQKKRRRIVLDLMTSLIMHDTADRQ